MQRRFWRYTTVAVVATVGFALLAGTGIGAGSSASTSFEAIGVADATQLTAGANSSVGESIGASDTVGLVAGQQLAAAESIGVSDSVSLIAGATLSVGESIGTSDAVSLVAGRSLTVGETIGAADTFAGEVVNTVPRLILPGTLTADEGSPLAGLGAFADPDPQTFTATADWGDGTPPEPLTLKPDKTFVLDHVYDDNALNGYTATISLFDGLATVKGTIHVDVKNVAPTATISNDGPVDEGSPATISLAAAHDPSTADTTAGFTYAYDCGSGYQSTATCTFDDQGTYAVKAKITDKDGGSTEYTTDVVVRNVAPTATFTAPATVAEGSPALLSFADQRDPSTADTTAGFTYAYDCGAGFQPNATCTFDDGPSSHVVRARIADKDGGSTVYTATIAVTNVAPTAALTGSGPVDEGAPATISFSGQADVSTADTAAGFSYSFACDGSTLGPLTTSPSVTCTFDDGPSTHVVSARILDKDGGYTDYTTSIDVRNVAPTATLSAPTAVDEGSSFAVSLGGVADPSLADTAAGFTYAFDCGDGSGLSAFTATTSRTCATTDNGARAIQAQVKDKDGGVSTYAAAVDVRNVAPTATLVVPASVNEGSSYTVALSAPVDPSSADTAAGFTYAFDCGGGYGPPGATPSGLCTATNEPGVTVRARITDKDGGTTEYTAAVAIVNLPPTVTITAPAAGSFYQVGSTVSFAGTFADPGVNDTHTARWTFDALTAPGTVAESGGHGTVTGTFTFTAAGVYTVTLAVTDNGGATGTATGIIEVFDPNAGFLTTGGWITDSAGKTTISGNARYKGTTPSGNITAQLSSGAKLKATTMRWLVIAGSKAQLLGDATLDGSAGYTFLLTAYSSPDAMRLKVWRADGTVVYDSTPGAPDDLDVAAPTPLGGGSVQLH